MVELRDRVIIVTGANSGVGFSLSQLLLEAGAHVVMVCRSTHRGEKARDELKRARRHASVELEIADLSDLASVRSLGERLSRFDGVHALVNNAGVWRNRLERNEAGLELTMATNHLGHFVLTDLLTGALRQGGRIIVNVSSEAHRRGKLGRAPLREIFTGGAWKGGLQAYSDSKQANVLFTTELVRRLGHEGFVANSLHPGVLSTMIWNKNPGPLTLMMRLFKPVMSAPAVGGRAVMRLLADPDLVGVTDNYFNIEKPSQAEAPATDERLAGELWTLSEELGSA